MGTTVTTETAIEMIDERGGYPSASGIERITLCPGSWHAEQASPPGEESTFSSEGTLLHAVLAGTASAEELTSEQEWVVRRCLTELDGLMRGLQFEPVREMREERLWTTEPRFSGQPDYVAIDENGRCLVVDFKTGRGDVPTADENHQLRALAVLAYRAFAVGDVITAIIQPRHAYPVTVAAYDLEALALAAQEIRETIDAANAPGAARIPGDRQCHYCRAKGACPEARGTALAVAGTAEVALEPVSGNAELFKLSGEEFATILPQIEFAEAVFDRIKILARAHLMAGGTIPGYAMGDGAAKRVIVDPQKAYERMPVETTSAEFIACCDVGVTKLENLYSKKTELRGKPLKEAFSEALGDAMEVKRNAPSLGREKGEAAALLSHRPI